MLLRREIFFISSLETSGLEGKQNYICNKFPEGPYIKCFVIYLKQTNKDGVQATTAQLYPGQDAFEFDQGHMTKNQPITVLILSSESLATGI